MKFAFFSVFFIVLLYLGIIALPVISTSIDNRFIAPSQMIGNFATFETGPAIIFPGLNNSYLHVDESLMQNDERMQYVHNDKKICNKSFDMIVIGDSFTETKYGLINEICRKGNLSALIFYQPLLIGTTIDNNPLILIDNLISSGYINATHPKYILLESAARGSPIAPIQLLIQESHPINRIACDIPSLNLWIFYGKKVSDIISGLNTSSPLATNTLSLMNLPVEIEKNNIPCRNDTIQKILYLGEPAMSEQPFLFEKTTIRFPHVKILPNSSLITMMGFDTNRSPKKFKEKVMFQIIVEPERGNKKIIYNESVLPEEGMRIISLPMDRFSGNNINLSFITYSNESYQKTNRNILWVNPTLITNSSFLNVLPITYTIGDKINFSDHGNSGLYRVSGWAMQEPQFVWTEGTEALIQLSIVDNPEMAYITLEASAVNGSRIKNQTVWISINNRKIPNPLVYGTINEKKELEIPPGYLYNGTNLFSFSLPYATVPFSPDPIKDNRNLGIAVRSFAIYNRTLLIMQPGNNYKNINSPDKKVPAEIPGSVALKSISDISPHEKGDYRPFISINGTIHQLLNLHNTSILSQFWDEKKTKVIFRVRDTIINTLKNQFDLPIPATSKARLTKRIHNSNIEYDTIYYDGAGDISRKLYSPQKLAQVNSNLNNCTERLKELNVTLLVLFPPDTSHIYEEYYVVPPEPKVAQMYEDLREASKKYLYIDAERLIKERVHKGELDLYPIFTRHWAPKTGSYVAEEVVNAIHNISAKV